MAHENDPEVSPKNELPILDYRSSPVANHKPDILTCLVPIGLFFVAFCCAVVCYALAEFFDPGRLVALFFVVISILSAVLGLRKGIKTPYSGWMQRVIQVVGLCLNALMLPISLYMFFGVLSDQNMQWL